MLQRVAIIALGALCCLFSGCGGCSKEPKPPAVDDGIPPRMKDAAYTNQLVQLQAGRRAVAVKVATIRAKLAKLGPEAEKRPEYADLTNQLAQCEAASKRIRREAATTVRARVLQEAESAKKGNLKK